MTTVLCADRWLHNTLSTDSTLMTTLGVTAIYADIAPTSAVCPFIIISGETAYDYRVMGPMPLLCTETWMVRAVVAGESYTAAEGIMNRVRALLNGSSGTVTSGSMTGTVLAAIAKETIRYPELYDGKQYRHLGLRFTVMTQ